MDDEIKKLVRHLGPSNCPFIDLPYLSLYLTEMQIRGLRDIWYDGRVRVLRWTAIKRGPDKGKIKCCVGLRNRDRSPHYHAIDPAHLVLM
jgi:hypothetical protein